MPATPVNADTMQIGAGWLYIGDVGSTEPTDLTTAWDADFVKIGYTEEGHTFTYDLTLEGIYVAEEIEPVRYENARLAMMVEFAMAEITATNLKRAMNGGTITTTANDATVTPPSATAAPTYKALGWESFDAQERIVWRKCVQAKPVAIARKKAPAYATMPVGFQVVKVAGSAPFVHIFDIDRS